MYSLAQYLVALEELPALSRTLGAWSLCRRDDGRPWFAAGNTAIVFCIACGTERRALRCYRQPMPHLRAIYGERLLERELYLFAGATGGVWVDVVAEPWIEGGSLREAIFEAVRRADCAALTRLSCAFDRLAADLLREEWAHGDLKPENMRVDAAGALHLIDFDTVYLPALAGVRSPGLGTAAYQHPSRTAEEFHKGIDDYPIALIATALHALRIEPELLDRYGSRDGLLFDPAQITADEALREVLTLFRARGLAAHYRLAELLASPTLRLPQLPGLLDAALREVEREAAASTAPTAYASSASSASSAVSATSAADASAAGGEDDGDGAMPELFVECGRWGYRTAIKEVVPPLYDGGFDFSEGLAAVQLAGMWHYIDPTGRPVIHCPGCEAVKPFRGGEAVVLRNGIRCRIDRGGRFIEE